MNPNFTKYSAAGNIIGVAHYPGLFDVGEFTSGQRLREDLKTQALAERCDSVMVLVQDEKDRDRLETVVFEPNNTAAAGGLSTMCGNGIRALAAYADEYLPDSPWPLLLNAPSGPVEVQKISAGQYKVRMGRVVTDRDTLNKYFRGPGLAYPVGFTTTETDAKKIDGEPHLVIEVDPSQIKNLAELKQLATERGGEICKNLEIFPLEINVNFVAQKTPNSFFLCTYERNLGDNAEKCVTAACGTGATFAASQLMTRSNENIMTAHCPGGVLTVEKKGEDYYLSGGVEKLSPSSP